LTRSATPAARPRSDLRRIAAILAVIAALIAVPSAIVGGIGWLDLFSEWSGAGRPLPKWVTSGEVRATTRDGTLVKLRVAFDAGSNSTKSAIQRRMRELSLVLEVSIGAHSTPELAGAQGLTRLSQDILRRVNDYLGREGVDPVKSVAIQDFWTTRP
jgi:hypothetical protein